MRFLGSVLLRMVFARWFTQIRGESNSWRWVPTVHRDYVCLRCGMSRTVRRTLRSARVQWDRPPIPTVDDCRRLCLLAGTGCGVERLVSLPVWKFQGIPTCEQRWKVTLVPWRCINVCTLGKSEKQYNITGLQEKSWTVTGIRIVFRGVFKCAEHKS